MADSTRLPYAQGPWQARRLEVVALFSCGSHRARFQSGPTNIYIMVQEVCCLVSERNCKVKGPGALLRQQQRSTHGDMWVYEGRLAADESYATVNEIRGMKNDRKAEAAHGENLVHSGPN
jgi:hypothetical protein